MDDDRDVREMAEIEVIPEIVDQEPLNNETEEVEDGEEVKEREPISTTIQRKLENLKALEMVRSSNDDENLKKVITSYNDSDTGSEDDDDDLDDDVREECDVDEGKDEELEDENEDEVEEHRQHHNHNQHQDQENQSSLESTVVSTTTSIMNRLEGPFSDDDVFSEDIELLHRLIFDNINSNSINGMQCNDDIWLSKY